MKQIVALLVFVCSTYASAVDITELNQIETIEVVHKGFKEPLTYHVTLPQSYSTKSDKTYFVLFDLHPRSQTFISGMQDWLSHNGEWPWLETIIVNPADYHAEFATVFNDLVQQPDNQTILDILQNGVLTQVDKRYRTNGFRIYTGFMGNGALGIYTLLNRPSMFDAYIISSPSLNDNFANVMSDAPDKLAQPYDGIKTLYMSIGDHAYEKSHADEFKQFKALLDEKATTQLHWTADFDEKHYYMSRPIISLVNGIEVLFDDIHSNLPADSDISQRGADAIIEYYQTLSREKYGFDISAEGSLKNLAKTKEPKQALAIYQKTAELYPDSAYAHASLAKAYADMGNIKKAIEVQTVALEKSRIMVQWHQNQHQKYLDEFKAMLDE
ncbi:tetratricopeptide repeat protein [Thalassotalea sp. HSM 43]|uniref:tetratricopeptide repeat protein n=1 Tax=Thalassotalea sp. HSM 43 TaxID=2552945 RepID=UPI001081DCD4|nr:tetratricopeptide repeat protein [Thalassotalea sp. HSM 43]QBY02977.1 tetratricopeptide repeat protein [Thalassotalea sp. HSM 43]